MIRTLLQVPLGLKLLIGNGVLLGTAVLAGLWLGRAPSSLGDPAGVALVVVILGMIGVNWLLVKIALGPVKVLEAAAERVARGDPDIQVPSSPVADPTLQRLTSTFNHMLDATGRIQAGRDRLARELLDAGERDRKLLAEELLAGPAQTLSATLLLLRGNGRAGPPLDLVTAAVRETLEQLRRIAAALHPPELDELGLATALRALVRARLESREIRARVKVEGAERGVPPEARLGAYRLVQEAVDLAAHMPELEEVSLWLRRDGPSLLIQVRLSWSRAERPEGAPAPVVRLTGEGGPRRMLERARLLGGDLRIEEESDREVAIQMRIPVALAPAASVAPSDAGPSGAWTGETVHVRDQPPRASRTAQ